MIRQFMGFWMILGVFQLGIVLDLQAGGKRGKTETPYVAPTKEHAVVTTPVKKGSIAVIPKTKTEDFPEDVATEDLAENISKFMPSYRVFKDYDARNKVLEHINDAKEGWYITVVSPFIRDEKIIKALNEAKLRGVNIIIYTKPFNIGNLHKLNSDIVKEGIQDVHAKLVLISSFNPEEFIMKDKLGEVVGFKNLPKDSQTFSSISSDNWGNTSDFGNFEGGVVDVNNFELFLKDFSNLYALKEGKPGHELSPLRETPKDKVTISSWDKSIADTVIARLDTVKDALIKDNATPFDLEMATMNLNLDKIARSLVSIAKKAKNLNTLGSNQLARLIVDRVAALPANKNLLQEISSAGVNVFVYNPYGKILRGNTKLLSLMHLKTFGRKLNDKYLTGVSTANQTKSGDIEFNMLRIDPSPGAEESFNQIKAVHNAIQNNSEKFSTIDLEKVGTGKKQKLK